ncbi:MAG: hypothetical protein Q7K57_03775 [Burkholderiaceae bacterium]|nr:hypothetical protein [Burkholderiaceae bacterium]
MRHPRDMSVKEVEVFLSMLASERRVSARGTASPLDALAFGP